MRTIKSKKGFTLIELMLYVGLSSILLLVISVFMSTLVSSRVKNQTVAEVEQQGLQVMQLITQTIRNAEAITAPAVGAYSDSLTLDVLSALSDPTIFDALDGVIRVKEGSGLYINLTNSRVLVSNLNFTNLSRADTPGTVRINFTLSYVNDIGRNEFSHSKTFIGSASLRQP